MFDYTQMMLNKIDSRCICIFLLKSIDITDPFVYNFASSIYIVEQVSGRSSVWLEYLVWDQGVEGSSPFAPTTFYSFS